MNPITDIQRQRDQLAEWASRITVAAQDLVAAVKTIVEQIGKVLTPVVKAFVSIMRAHMVIQHYGEPTLTWKVARYPRRLWHWAFGHSGWVSQLGGYCRPCDLWVDEPLTAS